MQSRNPPQNSSAKNRYLDLSSPEGASDVLNTIAAVSRRYQITALDDFIESCRRFVQEELLNIAVLGRFKTGKSSFLNQLLGQSALPRWRYSGYCCRD
jgi:predicted GTPase